MGIFVYLSYRMVCTLAARRSSLHEIRTRPVLELLPVYLFCIHLTPSDRLRRLLSYEQLRKTILCLLVTTCGSHHDDPDWQYGRYDCHVAQRYDSMDW